jgi:Tfp pilus assembly protein PilP
MMSSRVRLALVLACGVAIAASGQTQAPQEKPAAASPGFSYSSGGRRDPFKDLLQGQPVRAEKRIVTGLADLNVDDIVLMGIIKTAGKVEAIISIPEGFPITLHVGDVLADGYVLSIEETQVVFRKTRDAKGFPLVKPRDVVKDIIAEEP